MYDDLDPEGIKTWQIIALALVLVVLSAVATLAVFNIVKAVA